MYSGRDIKSGDNQSIVEAILSLVKNHAEMEKKLVLMEQMFRFINLK